MLAQNFAQSPLITVQLPAWASLHRLVQSLELLPLSLPQPARQSPITADTTRVPVFYLLLLGYCGDLIRAARRLAEFLSCWCSRPVQNLPQLPRQRPPVEGFLDEVHAAPSHDGGPLVPGAVLRVEEHADLRRDGAHRIEERCSRHLGRNQIGDFTTEANRSAL
jgi:hypothetical protein